MCISVCPFCQARIPSSELERHADNHFEEDAVARDFELAQQIAAAPHSPPSPERDVLSFDGDASYGNTSYIDDSNVDEKMCCLISMQVRDDFYVIKDGLMALLKRCLEADKENSLSIISGYMDHYQCQELVDEGWGCGWRNIQILSSHLLKHRQEAKSALFGGSECVPDIGSLQRWLEIAWERGFDGPGSTQFNNKIYGSNKWIGATECAALFRSFGFRARIVDFGPKEVKSLFLSVPGSIPGSQQASACNKGKRKLVQMYGPMDRFLCKSSKSAAEMDSARQKPFCGNGIPQTGNTSSSSSDPSKSNISDHQILFDWIWDYFSDNQSSSFRSCRVIVSEKSPLYFQHDGHSRTIIGIQAKPQRKGMQQYNLLVIDPGHRTEALERSLKTNVGWQKLIKRGVHTLKKPQYQLCYIDPGIANGEELEQLKTLDSLFFEF